MAAFITCRRREMSRKTRRAMRVRDGIVLVAALLALAVAVPAQAERGKWTTHGPEGGVIEAVAIDPSNPTTLYCGTKGSGLFKSTNGGASWVPLNSGLTDPIVVAVVVDPSVPTTVYAGTWSGVFKSTNGGASWRPA